MYQYVCAAMNVFISQTWGEWAATGLCHHSLPPDQAHHRGSSRIAKKVKKKRRTFKQIRISETRSIAIHLSLWNEQSGPRRTFRTSHSRVCYRWSPVGGSGLSAVSTPAPPVSIHWTGRVQECDQGGLAGQADPSCLPCGRPESGWGLGRRKGRVQGRGGRIHPDPLAWGAEGKSRGTRPQNRPGIPALPAPCRDQGSRSSPEPGWASLNLWTWCQEHPKTPGASDIPNQGVGVRCGNWGCPGPPA